MSEYDRKGFLGKGGFGSVFLVRSRNTGKLYVLKEVRISKSEKEQIQALTEVKVLARCRHLNIIRYKEASLNREKKTLSIVMEYADRGDLHAAIKRQNGKYFPQEDVRNWFVQMTYGLQYIHKHNILHRDLKTQNIFLTSRNLVKIGDFGIARVLKEDNELATTTIGTPYYFSPEICARKPYSFKSDIWALGCILYEISTLERPFHGANFHDLLQIITSGRYRKLPPNCDPIVEDLVPRLLHIEPARRPLTCEILAYQHLLPTIRSFANTLQSFIPIAKNDARRSSVPDIGASTCLYKRRSSVTHLEKETSRNESHHPSRCEDTSSLEKSSSFITRVISSGNVSENAHHSPVSKRRTSVPMENNLTRKIVNCVFQKLQNRETSSTKKEDSTRVVEDALLPSPNPDGLGASTTYYSFEKSDPKHQPVSESSDWVTSFPLYAVAADRCPHLNNCDRCITDILWKNRIFDPVDDKQRVKLTTTLEMALGTNKFRKIYQVLTRNYEIKGGDIDLPTVDILEAEQRRFLPLFIQLVQLDFFEKMRQ